MNTMTRYNKKFFAVSKVYDTALMTDNEIESSIQKDLDTLTGNTGLVRFQLEVREKEIILRFIRCIDYGHTDPEEEILDADAYILCGISLNGFKLPDMWYVPLFGYSYSFEHKIFKECYKKSAFLLGADQVKWCQLKINESMMALKIR